MMKGLMRSTFLKISNLVEIFIANGIKTTEIIRNEGFWKWIPNNLITEMAAIRMEHSKPNFPENSPALK